VPSLIKLVPVARRLLRGASAAQAVLAAGPPLPPPSRRADRWFAVAAHATFLVSVPVSLVFVFGFSALEPHLAWLSWTKMAFGLLLAAEGLALAKDWRGARRLTVWRLVHRRPADPSVRGGLTRRLASPGLMVLGGVWAALGVLVAALALSQLV
jgi:hypothetical protein